MNILQMGNYRFLISFIHYIKINKKMLSCLIFKKLLRRIVPIWGRQSIDYSFKWVVDKEATATQKGSKHEECKVCGYKKAAVEIPATGSATKPTDPTQTNPNTGAESQKTGDNSNMILWIALLFISGGAVIGITVYSKKKKENAE